MTSFAALLHASIIIWTVIISLRQADETILVEVLGVGDEQKEKRSKRTDGDDGERGWRANCLIQSRASHENMFKIQDSYLVPAVSCTVGT